MTTKIADQKEKILQEIAETLQKNQRFFIAGHQRPDGDTIGSQLALGSMLTRLGKHVVLRNREPVPEFLRFLPGTERILAAKSVPGHFDVVIALECSEPSRMGGIIDLKTQADIVINMDHHLGTLPYGNINLASPSASSNAEQIWELFHTMKLTLTQKEASCLYVGLVTDTGKFQHANTHARCHEMAAELIQTGISPTEIGRKIYETKTGPALKLLGAALSSLEIHGGKIAVMSLTQAELHRADGEETEDIIIHPMFIPEIKMAILLREMQAPSEVKASLRSKGDVDVHALAKLFAGGGHKNASGATVPGDLKQVKTKILRAAKNFLR